MPSCMAKLCPIQTRGPTPNGIRIGPGEIYEPLRSIPQIAEAMVVQQVDPGNPSADRLVLLIVPAAGAALDGALKARIRKQLAADVSSAHVPARIVEVAEDPAFGGADTHARRLQLVLDAVRAEVALLGGMRVRIDEQLIVRACDHARAATDARRGVEIDDAVTSPEERARGADVHARRVRALIAQHGEE